jgi:ribosomal-protein-alanine N-acetyltransferase
MLPQVRIDAMNEGDLAAVAAIDTASNMTDEQLRAEMQRPWSRLWVAREDGVGVVAFVIAWHVAEELHILNVATRVDRRRRGIARALMTEVMKYARTERIDHVLLEVRFSNRAAIALYRGEGFFAMGVRTRYYPDDEDALEMALRLDPQTREIVPQADEVRLES